MSRKGRIVTVIKAGAVPSDLGIAERCLSVPKGQAKIDRALFAAEGLIGLYRPQRLTWQRRALAEAERLVDEYGAAASEVYCSYPVAEAIAVGLTLKRRHPDLRLTVEFRDGLSTETIEGPKSRLLFGARRAFAAIEREALRRADTVLTVSNGLSAALSEKFWGRPVLTALNGYEPRPSSLDAQTFPESLSGKSILLHTGSTVRKEGCFLELCGQVSRLNEAGSRKLAFVQLGEAGDRLRRDAARRFPGIATFLGAVPNAEAEAYQRQADALVILSIDGERRTHVLTGKLFEYLFAGVPILCLMPGTEAADVIAETGTGVSARVGGDDAYLALEAIALGTLPYRPMGLERYTFASQMARLGEYWDA